MKICDKCGMQMPDTAKFCRMCGNLLGDAVIPQEEEGTAAEEAVTAEKAAAAEEAAAAEAFVPAEEPAAAETLAAAEPLIAEPAAAAEKAAAEPAEPEKAPAAEPVMASEAPAGQRRKTDHTMEFDQADISENKVFAMAAYLLGPIGLIIAAIAGKGSPYSEFHVRQGLKLQIAETLVLIIVGIAECILWAPLYMTYSPRLFGLALILIIGVIFLILRIACFVMACRNKAVEVPIVRGLKFMR